MVTIPEGSLKRSKLVKKLDREELKACSEGFGELLAVRNIEM